MKINAKVECILNTANETLQRKFVAINECHLQGLFSFGLLPDHMNCHFSCRCIDSCGTGNSFT